jgi:hypothetical protein
MACGGSDPSDDALSLGEQSGFLAELDVQDDTTLSCSGSATTEPIGFENIDGVVALPTSPTPPALQTSTSKGWDEPTDTSAPSNACAGDVGLRTFPIRTHACENANL